MSTHITNLTYEIQVGIWTHDILMEVYDDKIIITIPYVKWKNKEGTLDFKRECIRNKPTLEAVMQELNDDCADTAIDVILGHINY